MRLIRVGALLVFAATVFITLIAFSFTVGSLVNAAIFDQSKMEVKTVHRIVYFECGKHKFRVGSNGVKAIGIAKDQPGMWIIELEDGDRTIVLPTETVLITEEQQNIIVPNLVTADGTNKAQ